MAALTQAQAPSTYVTEVPGRFAPFLIIDKRNISTITASTATSAQMAYLTRAEQASNDFNTPLTTITELGTNFNVGDIDDIPENKISLSCYDVGTSNMSLLTGKATPAGTTSFGFNDLNNANIDIVRQYASPDGTVFYSEFMSNHVVEKYQASFKAKGQSMEAYDLVGFNTMGFRGFIQSKAYIVQAADVTANSFSIAALLGTNEGPVQIPNPAGPQSMWLQSGHNWFLKIERWRPATGFIELQEGTAVSKGVCKYDGTSTISFAAGDLTAGDVFLLTYMTYGTSVSALSTLSGVSGGGYAFNKIPQTKLNTSDPVAVPTRLTPITISANKVSRGQQFDLTLTLKRERAEGIGDTMGMFGPSDSPEVALSLDVKMTDSGLNGIMQTGNPNGTDNGGSVNNDVFDPSLATRNQLSTNVPVVVTVNDPRNSGTTLKTITSPTAVFNQRTVTTPAKGMSTVKYSGKDQVGNISISVTK